LKFKDIIKEILLQREDLNKDRLMELIDNRKSFFQGLLSEEGAALLVAQDLSVNIDQEEIRPLQIDDLVSDLNNITITGRVIHTSSIKEFVRTDGSSGKYIKLILADKTGKIFCTAWDSKAEKIAKKELQNKIVKILHGYTRKGINSEVELHIGDRGDIITSNDKSEENFPNKVEKTSNTLQNESKNGLRILDFRLTKISDLTPEIGSVNVLAKVMKIGKPKKSKNSIKKDDVFVDVLIGNKDGIVKTYFWDDKVKLLGEIKEGAVLLIQGAFAKKKFGRLFLTVNKSCIIKWGQKIPISNEITSIKIDKISDIKQDFKLVSIEGKIVDNPNIKNIETKNDEKLKLASFKMNDGSGIARIFLWRELADFASRLNSENMIRIFGLNPRYNENNELDLQSDSLTFIEKIF